MVPMLAVLLGMMAVSAPPSLALTRTVPLPAAASSRHSPRPSFRRSARRARRPVASRSASPRAAHPTSRQVLRAAGRRSPIAAAPRRSPAFKKAVLHSRRLHALRHEETVKDSADARDPLTASPADPPAPTEVSSNAAVDEENIAKAQERAVSLTRKRSAMPPPLRGSLVSLERQNEKADAEGLERIEDEDDLADRIAHKVLVPVPASSALTVNGNLPPTHRYCRPWTARFLADLARAHAARFSQPLEVSSAVRTVEYQKRLMGINGNAAAAEGDIVSPHLTGATIDIAKHGLTRQEIGWMRAWLLPLQQAGKIDVEEEFQQACFHITVYETYVPARPLTNSVRAKAAPAGNGAAPPAAQKRRTQTQPRSRPSDTAASAGPPAMGR